MTRLSGLSAVCSDGFAGAGPPLPSPPWWALLLAGAAGLLLLCGRPPPVPAYALAIGAGAQVSYEPGSPPGPLIEERVPLCLGPDDVLGVVLRPAREVRLPVGVRAFLVQGGARRPWQVRFERSPGGTFLLRGPVRELAGTRAGPFELIFLVGPAGAGIQVLRAQVEIVPSRDPGVHRCRSRPSSPGPAVLAHM